MLMHIYIGIGKNVGWENISGRLWYRYWSNPVRQDMLHGQRYTLHGEQGPPSLSHQYKHKFVLALFACQAPLKELPSEWNNYRKN